MPRPYETPEYLRPTKAEADRDAYYDMLDRQEREREERNRNRGRNVVNGPRVYPEGIKCGYCKEHHLTVDDVRWCGNVTAQLKAQRLLDAENTRHKEG